MIALQTYAHHIEQPPRQASGVRIAPKGNWVLGAERQVTVFIALPEHFPEKRPWKAALTLHFPWDSFRLTSAQKKELQALPKNQAYQVLGYASHPGPDSYNYRLGLERAQAVAHLLEQTGVSTSVRVLSWGNAFASTNPAKYAQDQKAVVAKSGPALP